MPICIDAEVMVEVVVDELMNHRVDSDYNLFPVVDFDGDISVLTRDSTGLTIKDNVSTKACIWLTFIWPKGTSCNVCTCEPFNPILRLDDDFDRGYIVLEAHLIHKCLYFRTTVNLRPFLFF